MESYTFPRKNLASGLLIWRFNLNANYDGIKISDKPTWEHTAKELWAILGKRIIALPSKLLGFKPFVLYIATWLLVMDKIRDWIWFSIVVIVMFGVIGLKVLGRYKNENQ